jgi:DNA-binding MarR family transcriptional regulator
MVDANDLIDLFFDNIKHLFFPENWLQLDLKFTKSELFGMILIDKRKEITMTELSDYIKTPMSTANGIIERLVKKGLVVRERSDSDRRIVVLRLTEEGARFIGSLKELVSGYLNVILSELSEEETAALTATVLKIVKILQNRLDVEHQSSPEVMKQIPID